MCVSSVSIDLIPLVFVYGGPASSGWGVGNFLLKAARKKKMVVGGTFRQRTAPFPLGVTSRFLATTRPTNSETPLLIKKGSKQLTFFFWFVRSYIVQPISWWPGYYWNWVGELCCFCQPWVLYLPAKEERWKRIASSSLSLARNGSSIDRMHATTLLAMMDHGSSSLSLWLLHPVWIYTTLGYTGRQPRALTLLDVAPVVPPAAAYTFILYIYIFSVRLFLFPWWSFTPEPERITTIRPSDGQLC